MVHQVLCGLPAQVASSRQHFGQVVLLGPHGQRSTQDEVSERQHYDVRVVIDDVFLYRAHHLSHHKCISPIRQVTISKDGM